MLFTQARYNPPKRNKQHIDPGLSPKEFFNLDCDGCGEEEKTKIPHIINSTIGVLMLFTLFLCAFK